MINGELYYIFFTEKINDIVSSSDYFYCIDDLLFNYRGYETLTVLNKNDKRIRVYHLIDTDNRTDINDIKQYRNKLRFTAKKYIFERQLNDI